MFATNKRSLIGDEVFIVQSNSPMHRLIGTIWKETESAIDSETVGNLIKSQCVHHLSFQ